jgi:malonyl-CoA decarboxylase
MTRSHTSKSIPVLLRARMHPDPLHFPLPQPSHPPLHASASAASSPAAALDRLPDGYRSLDSGGRREVFRCLSTDYDVLRARVRDLMRQYMSLASAAAAEGGDKAGAEEGKEGAASSLYRMERGLRDALQPRYSGFLEAMNAQPGGLKLLAVLRADLLALLG